MPPLEPAGLELLKRWLAASLVGSKFNYRHSLYAMEDLLHSSKRVWRMTATQARRLWERSLKTDAVAGHPLLIYLHYPHCRFKCMFCNTPISQLPDAKAVRLYLEDCRREIEFFAPSFEGRSFDLWRVGGGTPSLLDAGELKRWLAPAAERFSFARDSVRTIEFHPASSTRQKLAAARSLGFNRVSFGVQSLNAQVLRSVHRGFQDRAMVDRALRWARDLGFETVNADLIVGLVGESASSFLEGFRSVAASRPTMITVYCLDWLKPYGDATGWSAEAYERYRKGLLPELLEELPRQAELAGYRAEMFWPERIWTFVALPARPGQAKPRREHDDDGSTLGFGWNSSSHVFGKAIFVRRRAPFSPGAQLFNVSNITLKDEMARWVSFQLQWASRVDYADFRRCFGLDIRPPFALELEALRSAGRIREDAAGFDFLPVGSAERAFYAAFFFIDAVAKTSPPPKGLRDRIGAHSASR